MMDQPIDTMEARVLRARSLKVEPIKNMPLGFMVTGSSGTTYMVNEYMCTCPDFFFRREDISKMCKHRMAASIFLSNRARN